MKFSSSQFDKVIDRTKTWTIKWDPDYMMERFNRTDLLPFNHAELDFECPQPVIDAIKKRAEHGIYGYTLVKNEYYESVIDWFRKRYNITYKREDLQFGTGIIHSYRQIINHFTFPGDEVLVFTPIYRPFFEGVEEYGRKLITNSLLLDASKYYVNFELLEKTLKNRSIKLLTLCNPHNPVGRVWTKNELRKLGDLCVSYNVLIVSDEIHSDLTRNKYLYTPLASISKDIADHSIILTAPTKTFNLSGLKISNYHIINSEIRQDFYRLINKKFVYAPNMFGIVATMAAYNECEEYANLLRMYLDENYTYIEKCINEMNVGISVVKREGTPTIWLDFRDAGIPFDEIFSFLLNKAKLISLDGKFFGDDGNGFQRLSLGLPRSIIIRAMQNIKQAFETLK